MSQKPRFQSKKSAIDADLVDRIFEYLSGEYPELAGARMEELKAAVRAEFSGIETYIKVRSAVDRHRQAQQILALFNGRNAREVARRLGISRASVYRVLKQPRLPRPENRLSFPRNETAQPVASKRVRERAAETITD